MRWINARYAGSCGSCRATVMRGDKICAGFVKRRPVVLCRACGGVAETRAADKSERERGAYVAARQTQERES